VSDAETAWKIAQKQAQGQQAVAIAQAKADALTRWAGAHASPANTRAAAIAVAEAARDAASFALSPAVWAAEQAAESGWVSTMLGAWQTMGSSLSGVSSGLTSAAITAGETLLNTYASTDIGLNIGGLPAHQAFADAEVDAALGWVNTVAGESETLGNAVSSNAMSATQGAAGELGHMSRAINTTQDNYIRHMMAAEQTKNNTIAQAIQQHGPGYAGVLNGNSHTASNSYLGNLLNPSQMDADLERYFYYAVTTAATTGGIAVAVYAVATYGATTVITYVGTEIGETIFEETTGLPAIFGPDDVLQFGAKKAAKNAAGAAREIAPAAHPGLVAAELDAAGRASIMRSLRAQNTPEAHAVAKLLKRGKIELEILDTDPIGLGAAGRKPWGSNVIHIYRDAAGTAHQAAGIAVHEAKHWLQNITPSTYRRVHEFEAYQFQRSAGYLGLTDDQIWNLINTSPLYRHVRQ
jgi:hypothetical protein